MNYKEEDKQLIENTGKYIYYDFTEEKIKNIVAKDMQEVTNEEWRTLIQMLYPQNLICSGLLQPILIFDITKNGKRKDPPKEAYNSLDDMENGTCLFFRILERIEKNSNIKIDKTWYEFKERIEEKEQ